MKGRHCETDTVNRNRPFLNDIPRSVLRIFDNDIPRIALSIEAANAADAVDVTSHNVAAKSRIAAHRSFEVHNRSIPETAQTCAFERFARHLCGECIHFDRARSQAHAIHRNARTGTQVVEYGPAANANRPEI